MAEQGDGLVRMLLRQTAHRAVYPFPKLRKGLRVVHLPVRIGAVEQLHLPGELAADQTKGQVLPVPQLQLPQAGIGAQLQPLERINGPGGGRRPEQVAGVDRVNMDIPEARLQGGNLPVAVVGDEGVVPAVDPAVQVALGLGVADEVDRGHRISPFSFQSGLAETAAPAGE